MAIVIKHLNKTDINKQLTIPKMCLNFFPPLSGKNMVDFQVRDEGGFIWEFRLCTRNRNNNNKYLKPVLAKGWLQFVCSKGLSIGDRVSFYLDKEKDKDGSVKYRIQVEKQVKLFGAVGYHNPL